MFKKIGNWFRSSPPPARPTAKEDAAVTGAAGGGATPAEAVATQAPADPTASLDNDAKAVAVPELAPQPAAAAPAVKPSETPILLERNPA